MRAILAAILLFNSAPALAQDMPPPGAMACSGCHGAGSELSLDGLDADEIESAMLGFKDGTREATLMSRLAAGFDAEEIAHIAAWIAQTGGTP